MLKFPLDKVRVKNMGIFITRCANGQIKLRLLLPFKDNTILIQFIGFLNNKNGFLHF